MLFSFHIGFSLVSLAVLWTIIEMISGFHPSSMTTGPRYLKLDTVSNLCPFTLIFLLMTLIYAIAPVHPMLSHRYHLQSVIFYCPSSDADCSYVIFEGSIMILSKNMLNTVGERRQPWRTPMAGRKHSPKIMRTVLVALS